ncbi:MAG: hypothetical protein NW201_05775, partial [Gemmatimonadales bacterium]|nr:hypothetical protein [Gemmatimonadales bacterium]
GGAPVDSVLAAATAFSRAASRLDAARVEAAFARSATDGMRTALMGADSVTASEATWLPALRTAVALGDAGGARRALGALADVLRSQARPEAATAAVAAPRSRAGIARRRP